MSLSEFFSQSATLKHVTSVDKWNKPTTSSSTILCRIEKDKKRVTLNTGEVVTVDGTAFLPAGTTVAPGDYLSYGSDEWRIVGVTKNIDKPGVERFVTVYF